MIHVVTDRCTRAARPSATAIPASTLACPCVDDVPAQDGRGVSQTVRSPAPLVGARLHPAGLIDETLPCVSRVTHPTDARRGRHGR
jgi:hypothetical protein